MNRTKSSNKWLKEHFRDEYVIKAQKMSLRSRAAFKLLEIQLKEKLIKPGMVVVDLGAAPGGWTQVVADILKGKGELFSLDILPMDPVIGANFIQGDFREQAVLDILIEKLKGNKIDIILSDMSPNIGGISVLDQARSMLLAELALDFVMQALNPGGDFLVKLFQGYGFEDYINILRTNFKKIRLIKPKASRARSNEVYALSIDYRGN